MAAGGGRSLYRRLGRKNAVHNGADILAKKGVTLSVKEFTDYVQPNNVVNSGEMDANYFQHKPYLDDFNKENKTAIVSAGAIHVEPMGLYGGKQDSLNALK